MDAMSFKDVQLVFPFFLYYAYPTILRSRIYLFFSAALFTVNSKMLNEFERLNERLIK